MVRSRIAVVGGGGSGIGRAAAARLARAGARVIVAGRSAERLEATVRALSAETGTELFFEILDVSDPDAAPRMVAKIEQAHGGIDVLVLNAGGPPPGRVLDLDDRAWQAAFELLVQGPIRLARLVLPGMRERGFGRVVAVTSTAVRRPQPDLAASVVLRSAMEAAARLLALEVAADGVTVNCVAPGATATDRFANVIAGRASAGGRSVEEAIADEVRGVPAGRLGDPDEVAAAIAFLASDAAAYINGTVLTVDGGRTEAG